MIQHVICAVEKAGIENIAIVYGKKSEILLKKAVFYPEKYVWIQQHPALGTGHAVQCAYKDYFYDKEGTVIVLNADAPFIRSKTIEKLIENLNTSDAALLVAEVKDPFGYGRIIEEDGLFNRIVEEKDASQEEKEIKRVNAGVYGFEISILEKYIFDLDTKNAQGEYYLTDMFGILKKQNKVIGVVLSEDEKEILNINTLEQLQFANSILPVEG